MKFHHIKKIHEGKFITGYNIHYKTKSGKEKQYEIISRNPDIESGEDLAHNKVDAVVMIMHNKENDKILLNCEYRMAVNQWVYNFPAGLIDDGEGPEEAAARELREETGLELEQVLEVWKESYSAVGFSNEKVIVLVGQAVGEFKPSHSEMEEIKAGWFTRDEISQLLKTEMFAARTQAYCMLWSKEKK